MNTESADTFWCWNAGACLTLLLVALGLSGCAPASRPASLPQVEELASPSARSLSTNTGSDRKTLATFDEGTNMAIALSPDGERFVLSIQGTLFELPAEGGEAHAITDYYQDAREPQFSADSKQVVYHGYKHGNWNIFALALDSGSIRQLTSGPYDDREPVFAPDMASVVFSSDRSGNYDLWQLSLADSRLTQLTTGPEDEYSPSFFQSGEKIAFAHHSKSGQTEVRTLNLKYQGADHPSPAGHSEKLLLSESGTISGVSVAPDSKKIAYQLLRRDRAGHAHTELKIADVKGNTLQLSSKGADVFPFRAAWTPSTETGPTGNSGLVMAVNGKLKRFTLPAEASQTKKINSGADIVPFTASFTLNRTGYSRKPRNYGIQSKPARGIVAPALSFTGEQVAFTALGDLWQWDFTSDELQQLTDDRYAEATPSYSPDGKHIAYVSDRNGTSQLWLHNLSDGTQRVLDEELAGVSYPSWSPDGKRIAYFGELPENPLGGQLMLADLESGTRRTVGTPTAPQPLSWSKDGAHLAATVLSPYSKRYREGVYELLVFSTAGKEVARVTTQPHKSPFDVRLTPDGSGVGYVQGGELFYQKIDQAFKTLGAPRKLSNTLADMPAWSGDGKTVLVLSGDRLRRFEVATGKQLDSRIVPLDYSRQVSDERWTLRTSRLFDGVDQNYKENIDVIVNGNRIEALNPRSAASPKPVVDVSEHSVIPGLFEMHAHMGNLREPQGRTWLAYGITTVRDPGSNPYLAKERQEVWDSGRRPGPRTHITGYLTDGNRVFYPIAEGLTPDNLDLSLSRTKLLELDFIKTYVRLDDSEQRKVVSFAHDLGIPTSSHELFPAAAHGMDHVEHIGGTSRRGYQPKVSDLGYSYKDVLELLTASNMGITATAVLPAWAIIFKEDKDLFQTPAFKHFYGPDALKGYAGFARRFGDGPKSYHAASSKLLKELVERDALLVTGTDSPFVPYGTGLHAELRLFERAGIAPWQVLRAATAKAAQAAGVEKDLGVIRAGMLADLVVVSGDPLATIKDVDNVVLTIKGGHRYPLEELLNH